MRNDKHGDGDKRQRRAPRPRVLAVVIVSMLAISLVGATPAGAAAHESTEDNMGNHGWYSPANRDFDVEIKEPECIETDQGFRWRVKVRAVMWTGERQVQGFEFKAQLVPVGGSSRAWGSPARRTFSTRRTTPRVQRTLAAHTNAVELSDSQGGLYDYNIRLRFKFDRVFAGDYVYRSTVRVVEPTWCGSIIT